MKPPTATSATRALRALYVLLFVVASWTHASKALAGQGDVLRHEIFVAIDLGCAALLALRPRWALYAVALLALQQLPSHGGDFVESLTRHRDAPSEPIDWTSLGVLVFFAAVLVTLVVERRRGRPGPPSPGPRGS
jgi:hypothetical protein